MAFFMSDILITTFKRLLRVSLNDRWELEAVRSIDEQHGIYFGLARRAGFTFVAERNLDIDRVAVTAGSPENAIRLYIERAGGGMIRTPLRYTDTEFDDLHQIASDRLSIFVTSAKYPFLFRKSLLFGTCSGIDVQQCIPHNLRRGNVEARDAYHFNSVSIDEDDLLLLAHNWNAPSFALRLSLSQARQGRAQCQGVYDNLGSCCHDILAFNGAVWILDSGGSALLRIDTQSGERTRYPLKSAEGSPFPRGLAACGSRLLVSYGFNSEDRAARMHSGSMLAVFDPEKRAFEKHVYLGNHGNTCAIHTL